MAESRGSFRTGVVAGFSFAAGFLGGTCLGAFLGFHALLGNWVEEQAGDVAERVGLLRELRAGERDKALERLEARLDDDVVVLVPEGYWVRRSVRGRIGESLSGVRDYRAAHPRKSSRGFVDEMVKTALSDEYLEKLK